MTFARASSHRYLLVMANEILLRGNRHLRVCIILLFRIMVAHVTEVLSYFLKINRDFAANLNLNFNNKKHFAKEKKLHCNFGIENY